ncbi:ATP-binding protein [Phenylobacterium sp.]|uniref:sensor histidine kinase n=1 Tax=Phenylobacterium sp. TaxID=1871053 RepID=UPI0028128164|nr:ATP-binding protein [Phenylobacterium sp.]
MIAAGRLALATTSLAAIYLDGTQPEHFAGAVRVGVWSYVAVAFAWCLLTARGLMTPRLQFLSHAADMSAVTGLMYLTDGATSPFFVFFTFILITATLRWDWRGAVATAAVLVLLFLGVLGALSHVMLGEVHELNRTIVRAGYLMVAGGMLGYFGAHRERSRTRLAQLVSWPGPESEPASGAPSASSMSHVAAIMGARQVVLLWREDEEPGVQVAHWDGRDLSYGVDQTPPREADPASRAPCGRIAAEELSAEFVRRYPFKECLTAPFQLSLCSGHVFLLDPIGTGDDEMLLTDLIAVRLGVDIEHQIVRSRLAMATRIGERAKLARDLHDGLLQTLTASTLHLKLAASDASAETAARLGMVRAGLAEEQRQIRHFVEENRPRLTPSEVRLSVELRPRLDQLAREWGCGIAYEEEPADLVLGAGLCRHIRHLVTEAIANAARHGGASHVSVRVAGEEGRLELTIADNGRGFPDLTGEFGAASLLAQDAGPRSLLSRVAELGGELTLKTGGGGATVRIQLPWPNQ